MRFYKRLWREAEQDRREADAAVREMATLVVALLDVLPGDDHSSPEVRRAVRKLRRAVDERIG